MLNSIDFFACNIEQNATIKDAKDLFKASGKPYVLRDSVDGPKSVVVFDDHFIEMFTSANSHECIISMSKKEKELYWDYLTYQDACISTLTVNDENAVDEAVALGEADIAYRAIRQYHTPTLVVKALSNYGAAEVMELPENTCYSTNYKWD